LNQILIRLHHRLQSSLLPRGLDPQGSNLWPPSTRLVGIASSRKALLAMTGCLFGRNLL
jgi:hypothetical protein